MLECGFKKISLLRFTCHFPFLKRIAYFTKNTSCVILFQPSMCIAMGPGQDMLDSTQIIGRIIYEKAKVSCGPASFIFIQNYALKSTDIVHQEARNCKEDSRSLSCTRESGRLNAVYCQPGRLFSQTTQEPLCDCLCLASYGKNI